MFSCDPVYHLKHAWNETRTVWGKMALVLFYTWVWAGIFCMIWSLIDPNSQGIGCILDRIGNDSKRELYIYLLNGKNITVIGFLFYADMGGVHTKNVFTAALFNVLAFYFFLFKTTDELTNLGAEECLHSINVQKWLIPSWVVAALLCTILEELLGGTPDRGTTEERRPLSG